MAERRLLAASGSSCPGTAGAGPARAARCAAPRRLRRRSRVQRL